ncbi:MAG: DoxX family membrane protein [Dehalococcoidia bacterium]
MSIMERAFTNRELRDPSWFAAIFNNTSMAPLWLLARAYLGYQWLLAGWHKVWGDERWIAVEGEDGQPLRGFWVRATEIPEQGQPRITYDWYRDFLNYMIDHEWYTWFAWIVAFGEVIVGIALIVGLFTGLAALAGATLNFNFLLAGSASTNPVLFIIAVLILMGWKVAGWIGIDRWLLPALGTPWDPGTVVRETARTVSQR